MSKHNHKHTRHRDEYYILGYAGGRRQMRVHFPFPPENIMEGGSDPMIESFTPVGSTMPYSVYTGNAPRTLNFTVRFIDDYVRDDLVVIRDALESMKYPLYSSSVVNPPTVYCRLGDIKITGVLSACSFTWSGPERNGTPILLDCSMSITESINKTLDTATIKSGLRR